MNKMNMFSGLRDFFVLWSSQAVSSLGTAMTNFALIIWVYSQKGTASSITLLTLCSFLPTILFRFIAGAIADRWDKKRIMLLADLIAACGTVTVLALYSFSALRVWHLYIINFLLSFMNSFQRPAADVATSLLVPKEQYIRVSGLQSFSGSVITILAPALGNILLAFGGLATVLIVDLASFAVAFVTLLVFVKIPAVVRNAEEARETFVKSCMAGINFLREHTALLRMSLFFAVGNFLAKLGCDGMLPAYILGRTGGDQKALGVAQAAIAFGLLVGSVLVTFIRPAKSKTKVIFSAWGIAFLFEVVMGLTRSLPFWIAAAFASYVPVAWLTGNATAVMRTHVPIEMQGRVFSARDTIQSGTIPLSLFLGGLLADHVFEPFMAAASPVQRALAFIFGTGKGSGIAV
ncbi:MAG: MFS transporter, partial [Oscillospiraceae bacterium]|nr:MFS transporter [Oscillospiraceae bacterium]